MLTLWMILGGVGSAVCWRVSIALFPYTRCSRCDGSGRRSGSNRDRWGPCKRCGGSGRQERFGVRWFRRKDT